MKWQRRKAIHDSVMQIMELRLAKIDPIAISNEDRFRISFGFYRDKSTGNMDLDGMGYFNKIVIDAIAKKLGINDSFNRIIEVRTCYLGQRETESYVVQVERVQDICVQSRKKDE